MKTISLDDVSKRFILRHTRPKNLADGLRAALGRNVREEFWAVKDVSFDVEQGEALGIIGRNGAGKSTILKLMSSILEPTRGRLRKRGRICSLIEVGAGFHPEMTGRENIYLNGSILGMTRREIDAKFDQIVDFSDLHRFIDTPVKRYSSGMYARLGFSVAAHVDPDILIVDEVLAVGDAEFQKRCLNRMDEVTRGEGRTVVFVSHNLSAVQSLCTRAIYLRQGELVYAGGTAETIEEYLGRLHASAATAFEDNPERGGSGRLRLTGAAARGEDGRVTSHLVAGQSATIEFQYTNPSQARQAVVKFTVYSQSGAAATHINTDLTGFTINDLAREGTFACTIPRLPFPTGSYHVAIAVDVNGENADVIPNALVFNVVSSVFYDSPVTPPTTFCACMVDHVWSHRTNGSHDPADEIPQERPHANARPESRS